MTDLKLILCGAPRLEADGRPVPVARQKALALLAYLALTQQPHRRDLLAALLWPEANQTRARASLRRALSALQTARPTPHHAPLLTADATTISLPADGPLWVDVLQIRRLLAAPPAPQTDDLTALAQAVALYRGDFMAGFALPDCPEYEAWLRQEAETLRGEVARALDRLSDGLAQQGDLAAALEAARRWVQLDPLHEPAQVRLIHLLVQAGQMDAARQQARQLTDLLAAELGVTPDPATRNQLDRLLHSAPAAPAALPMPRFLAADTALPPAEPPLCVAREERLSQLFNYLEGVRAGEGQVVWITGEAGTGKTTLVREFVRRSLDADPDLLVAYGAGDPYAGLGRAYLPLHAALEMLTGALEEPWRAGLLSQAQARRLWQHAPAVTADLLAAGHDLLDTLVDRAGLAARVARWQTGAADKLTVPRPAADPPQADQPRLFEQTWAVLQRVAARHPLLLVLDDLHWADSSSLGLLAFLAKQCRPARLLILGTYRPEELGFDRAGRPHPLLEVREEVRRAFGDTEISLDQEGADAGRRFVDALLATIPNDLDEVFRQGLTRLSRGHPLFTVELIHHLQESRQLAQNAAGRWVQVGALTWEALPARVEGVIAKRLSRLDRELLELLSVASVEGEQFTAEVVAAACGVEAAALVRRLSGDLAKQHRLVQAQGVHTLHGQRMSRYRFRHNLFQHYLYHSLDPVERSYLHERVARALEACCAGQAATLAHHAGQLAYHFEAAHLTDQAIAYWQRAGEHAVQMSANEEAVYAFTRGLTLLRGLPADADRAARELALQVSLGVPISAVRGYSHTETAAIYRRARRLSLTLGDTEQLFPALYGLWRYHLVRGHLRAAQYIVGQLQELGAAAQDRDLQLEAARAAGITDFHRGAPASARVHLEQGLTLYHRARDAAHAFLYGHDPGVSCYSYLAPALWLLGYPDQAVRVVQTNLRLAEQLDHPFSLVHAWLNGAAQVYHMRREVAAAQEVAEAAVRASTKYRFPQWLGYGNVLWGAALAAQGDAAAGIALIETGLATLQSIHMMAYRGFFLALLAESCLRAGRRDAAADAVRAGLAAAAASGERAWEADLYRLQGEVLHAQGAPPAAVAAALARSLTVARAQQARSLELRARVSRAHLLQDEAGLGELAALVAGFGEGAATPDLAAARACLDRWR